MEPNKFEKDIKNKLEQRTLKPSENSWGKLSGSLQQKEQTKNYKFLWLMGAAASIVGILFIATIFSKSNLEKNTPIIVTVPKVNKVDTITKVAIETVENKDEKVEKLEVVNQNINASRKPNYKGENQKLEVNSMNIALNKEAKNDREIKTSEIENKPIITYETPEIEHVISKIQDLKMDYKGIEISEIDALLFNAQQELALQKIVDESIKTVDAYKLLQDVEADLDKSFRVKVLESLILNYENMKTVIAQRNN